MNRAAAQLFVRPIGSPVTIGMSGLAVLGLAAYSVLAFELEEQKRQRVLPTFRRGRAAVAFSDGVGRQLVGVAHEAGVRQTT